MKNIRDYFWYIYLWLLPKNLMSNIVGWLVSLRFPRKLAIKINAEEGHPPLPGKASSVQGRTHYVRVVRGRARYYRLRGDRNPQPGSLLPTPNGAAVPHKSDRNARKNLIA